MAVRIEVVFDVVCPWCYVGKRRLELALGRLRTPHGTPEVSVSWLPFQLNPGLPDAGMERAEYLRQKFGEAAAQVYGRVQAAGRSVGIDFAFASIARQPNTLAAHQLVAAAARGACQDAMVEALFSAYFIEGADLTQRATLIALAGRAGMNAARAGACLDDPAEREAVERSDREARALGVAGVPFFVFDRRLAVSGAQEPELLLQAVQRAAEGSAGAA